MFKRQAKERLKNAKKLIRRKLRNKIDMGITDIPKIESKQPEVVKKEEPIKDIFEYSRPDIIKKSPIPQEKDWYDDIFNKTE